LIQNNKYQCPVTNDLIDRNNVKVIANIHHPNYDKTKYVEDTSINKYGTKMNALINHIKDVVTKDPTSKLIIFTQWDKMLKLCGDVLKYHKIGYVTCQGNVHQISNSIREFGRNPDCKVVLLSAEKSSSGNNLVMADHIVLLDTINHPDGKSLEKQAIGRAVRLGQLKPYVYVKRMIIKDTIEERNFKSHNYT
jgi:E3 ubiquitin-protein ligase SHPRH